MPFMINVIAEMTAQIISSTMGTMFYCFLFKQIFQRKPRKPKEIPQGIMFRAEVEYLERDAQGKPKILYKNGLMSWDVRDVFVTFRRNAKVQTDGWQQT